MIVPSCLHSSAFNFLSFSRQNFNHELVEWSFCSCCDVSAPNKSALNGHDFNSSTPHSIRFYAGEDASFVANHTFRWSNQSSARPFEAFPLILAFEWWLGFFSHSRLVATFRLCSLVAHANLSHTSTAPRVVLICDFCKLFYKRWFGVLVLSRLSLTLCYTWRDPKRLLFL